MLFPARFWPGLADGSITVAFRRQKRATVRAGGTLNSPGGLLSIDEVTPISEEDITDADARAAGCADRDEILSALKPEGTLYRFRFHRLGDDPRRALRADDNLDEATLATLRRKLQPLDWAEAVLRVIAANPRVVSTNLAAQLGMERARLQTQSEAVEGAGPDREL